jgi:chitinase
MGIFKNWRLAVYGLFFWFAGSVASLPSQVLVGYWQNWSPLTLKQVHEAYNVIQIAFATTQPGSDHLMEFNLPYGYAKQSFLEDIAWHQQKGHAIILSIGGASDPVILQSEQATNEFIATMVGYFPRV